MTGYICCRGEASAYAKEGYNGTMLYRPLPDLVVYMVICHIEGQGTSNDCSGQERDKNEQLE